MVPNKSVIIPSYIYHQIDNLRSLSRSWDKMSSPDKISRRKCHTDKCYTSTHTHTHTHTYTHIHTHTHTHTQNVKWRKCQLDPPSFSNCWDLSPSPVCQFSEKFPAHAPYNGLPRSFIFSKIITNPKSSVIRSVKH